MLALHIQTCTVICEGQEGSSVCGTHGADFKQTEMGLTLCMLLNAPFVRLLPNSHSLFLVAMPIYVHSIMMVLYSLRVDMVTSIVNHSFFLILIFIVEKICQHPACFPQEDTQDNFSTPIPLNEFDN